MDRLKETETCPLILLPQPGARRISSGNGLRRRSKVITSPERELMATQTGGRGPSPSLLRRPACGRLQRMTEPSSSDPGDSRDHPDRIGIGSLSAEALCSLLDHLEARADLFRWEAREAKSRLLRRLIFLLLGAWMLIAACAVGVAALVAWLAESRGLGWPAAAGVVALGLLLAGAVLLLLARRRETTALFPDSIAELRRDRQNLRRRTDATRRREPR